MSRQKSGDGIQLKKGMTVFFVQHGFVMADKIAEFNTNGGFRLSRKSSWYTPQLSHLVFARIDGALAKAKQCWD